MFQLDENFLNQVGLSELPEEQKKPFLQHIYQELEMRVGTKLSDGMSDEQLEEFGLIIEQKDDAVNLWLINNAPNYINDENFIKLQGASNGRDDRDLKSEYAATKWLELNRPDYKDVVASVLNDIKQEIMTNKEVILGNTSA